LPLEILSDLAFCHSKCASQHILQLLGCINV
jgi:hypothetical protein